MKAIKVIAIGVVLFVAGAMQAQVSVSVHIGSPPQWGPVGYSHARYYYLPDVEAYYDIQTSQFIYIDGRTWVHRTYLPARYRGYDLYGGYKVVMTNYRGNTPYTYFRDHKSKYSKGYRGQAQRTIGNRPGKVNPGVKYVRESNRNYKGNDRNYKGNVRNNGKNNQGHDSKNGKNK